MKKIATKKDLDKLLQKMLGPIVEKKFKEWADEEKYLQDKRRQTADRTSIWCKCEPRGHNCKCTSPIPE